MLREMPGAVSLGRLLSVLGQEPLLSPNDLTLASGFWQPAWRYLLEKNWQIVEFRADQSQRRCDARWSRMSSGTLWSRPLHEAMRSTTFRRITQEYSTRPDNLIRVPLGPIQAAGFTAGENAIALGGQVYLLPGHPWEELISKENHTQSDPALASSLTADIALS